jgi:hypothetical protein
LRNLVSVTVAPSKRLLSVFQQEVHDAHFMGGGLL